MSPPLRILIIGTAADAAMVSKQWADSGVTPDITLADTAPALQAALTGQSWGLVISTDSAQVPGLRAHAVVKESGLDLPFILIARAAGEDAAVAAIRAGIHDYLTRDQLSRLVPVCERALAEARLRHEQRRIAAALRESEQRFRTILDNAADGIMIADERGVIESYNPAAARIFGYGADEVLGQNIRLLIPRPYLREHESYRSEQHSPAPSVLSLGREVIGRHKDGHTFPLDLSVSETVAAQKRLFTAIVRDMTERKRVQEEVSNSREQLRSLAARLQVIREEERTHISREIHDELGQSLTGVKMDLAWLQAKLPPDRADLQLRIQSMSGLVDNTIQTVRKIAAELRPGVLDNLGLIAALEWQASEFQLRTGIQCRCQARFEDQDLDADRCTAIFRIFQETLTNIMRHARATDVDVSIERAGGAILLRVQDNGRGITTAQSAGAKSLGLLGMRERALLFGGDFSISGAPGQGTTVTVRIPLP